MSAQFDILVYLGVAFVIVAFGIAAWLIGKTPETDDIETRKLRFAAVMFTGIMTLFIFVSILYFGAESDAAHQAAAKEIFDKAVTAMTPLAGVILGYIFQARRRAPTADPPAASADAGVDNT